MKNNIIAAYLLEGELAEKMSKVPRRLIPMRNAMIDAQKALEDALTPEQQMLFNKYYGCIADYREVQEQHHFTEGFKIGLHFKKEIEKPNKKDEVSLNFESKKDFIDYICQQVDMNPPSSYKTKEIAKSVNEKEMDCYDIAVEMQWLHGERELIIVRIFKDGVKSIMVWTNYSDNGFIKDVLDNYADDNWSDLVQVKIIN